MKLASVRLIARDVRGLVAFYETVTGVKADWLAPVFAEIVTPGASLAIGSEETVALLKEGSAEAAFERFGQLSEGQGSGLGLAIVKDVLRRHGGQAELVPQDKGLIVKIKIPLSAPTV